jgi:hypothetical protein
MTDSATTLRQDEPVTYCEVHPDRETALRCNKCGRLMCSECAVPTPVGYRCKQCVRQVESTFFNASRADDVIVGAVAAVCGAVLGGAERVIGLPLLFAILLGLPIGGLIAEAALRAIQRRRSRYSAQIAAAAVVAGGLLGALVVTYVRLSGIARGQAVPLDIVFQATISDIGLLLLVGLAAAACYGRFRMRS